MTDWQKDFGLPADIIKGGLCMSGMYDLKPVRMSKRSSYIKFTDEMEQAMSSQRHLDKLRAPVIATYGTNETPEFQRQNRDFAAACQEPPASPVQLIEAPSYAHFEMAESLGNPYGPNGRAALALMKLPCHGDASASFSCPGRTGVSGKRPRRWRFSVSRPVSSQSPAVVRRAKVSQVSVQSSSV